MSIFSECKHKIKKPLALDPGSHQLDPRSYQLFQCLGCQVVGDHRLWNKLRQLEEHLADLQVVADSLIDKMHCS